MKYIKETHQLEPYLIPGFFSNHSLKDKAIIFDIGNVILNSTYEAITLKATGYLDKLYLYTEIFQSDTWTKDACLGFLDEFSIAEKLANEFNLSLQMPAENS